MLISTRFALMVKAPKMQCFCVCLVCFNKLCLFLRGFLFCRRYIHHHRHRQAQYARFSCWPVSAPELQITRAWARRGVQFHLDVVGGKHDYVENTITV
ncbi:hypothetical protein K439DRAFT_814888 [Ramaria rubella]|nr:hypothetical protein K439DRAFT_814888 [Ramaria rubella]